jgi:mono/diheme cytochrome c family protein
MRQRSLFFSAMLAICLMLSSFALARGKAAKDGTPEAAASSTNETSGKPAETRISGEQRFHSNCGRCHAAPPKFPPRMMATIVRHMRVRATLTDEDMRLILAYMTK